MGGHGGLNILPQKRWNVYRFDNREKVRRDEEAATREDQLNHEQSRRRDAEFRLDRLRQARGLPSTTTATPSTSPAPQTLTLTPPPPPPPTSDSNHINLFDGIHDFSSLASAATNDPTSTRKFKRDEAESSAGPRSGKKQKREEVPPPVSAEDEKYKLGYGLAGKGVKAPWYLSKASLPIPEEGGSSAGGAEKKKGSGGKKTIQELREERMRREKQEKGRERELVASAAKKEKGFSGFSRRRY